MIIKKEINSGLRSRTFVIEEEGEDILYQEYRENSYYQAKKKYNITKQILDNREDTKIPRIYRYENLNDKAILYSQYKDGQNIEEIRKSNIKFSFSSITKDLAETLYNIHNSGNDRYFGWITDFDCVGKTTSFKEYINNEFNRFNVCFEKNLTKQDLKEIYRKEAEILDYVTKRNEYIKPQLIWYDINPTNILIKDNKFSCLVDAGGAKYAIKEIDLAFVKMEVCENEDEFKELLNEYKKLDNSIDETLIDKMSILVELDDILIRLQDKIFIKIPYSSNFRNIITRIQK